MNKKYIVRLTDQERDELVAVVKKLKGTSEKVRRRQILLKADADGPNWTDHRTAEAFGCRTQTVENVRRRFVEHGFREGARSSGNSKGTGDQVRSGKVLISSGCNSHPATGSLEPVAIGAAVEETKPSEPSRQTGRMATRRADRP